MKKEGHPETLPTCFVDVSTGKKFLTRSTLRSKQTESIDGVDYQVVVCDVTSDPHPAYTGQKRFVDTAGRVDKFNRKFGSRKKA